MHHTATPTNSPEKGVNPSEAQPKDSTLLFLMMFARLYLPVSGSDKDLVLN